MPRRGAPNSPNDAVTRGSGIPFVGVNLGDGNCDFSRGQEKIGQAPPEFAGWSVIVSRRILNIGQGGGSERDGEGNNKKTLHRSVSHMIKQKGGSEINSSFRRIGRVLTFRNDHRY